MGYFIRKNFKTVNEILEADYKDGMKREEGLKLIAKCLSSNIDNPKKNSEIVIVGKGDNVVLTLDELEKLYSSIEIK